MEVIERNRINQYFRIEKWDTIVENIMIKLHEALEAEKVDDAILRLKLMYVNLPGEIQEQLKEHYEDILGHIKQLQDAKRECDTEILGISTEFFELANALGWEREYGWATKPIPAAGKSQLAPEPEINNVDVTLFEEVNEDSF